jgi:hypothetical protein
LLICFPTPPAKFASSPSDMAFIRKKGQYAYLVESYRDEAGKPRQKVLAYLGLITEMDEKLVDLRKEHPEWFDAAPVSTKTVVMKPKTDYHPNFPPWDRRRD